MTPWAKVLRKSMEKSTPWVMVLIGVTFMVGGGLASAMSPPPVVLTVYSYDSFLGSSGLGPALFSAFEKKTQGRIRIKGVSAGDSVQLLSRVKLDSVRKKQGADLVLGIDQQVWDRIRDFVDRADDDRWEPREIGRLKAHTRLERGFVPFDYGVFAWMLDTQNWEGGFKAAPTRWSGLLASPYQRKLILQDPRTSAPGLGFLAFTHLVMGAQAEGFWRSFRPQLLTLPAGWDEAYGLFLKGEAPAVWSYTTSEAYHREQGESQRYRAIVFEEGNPAQIEGAAVLRTVLNHPEKRKAAREFLDFLISDEAQALVPLKNWMLPAREGVKLPKSFQDLAEPKKIVVPRLSGSELDLLLQRWSKAIRS